MTERIIERLNQDRIVNVSASPDGRSATAGTIHPTEAPSAAPPSTSVAQC